MSTKYSIWDIRRREHGKLLETAVLEEMRSNGILESIERWDGLIRPKRHQPFFKSSNGSSECELDDFGWVADETRSEMRSCIVEVKAMRAIDWHEWQDHDLLHLDKLNQRLRHLKICQEYGFDGAAFIALNKDSSEISIRVFDKDDTELARYIY